MFIVKIKVVFIKITKKTCEELLLNANLRFGLKYTIMKFGSI